MQTQALELKGIRFKGKLHERGRLVLIPIPSSCRVIGPILTEELFEGGDSGNVLPDYDPISRWVVFSRRQNQDPGSLGDFTSTYCLC